MDTRNIWISKKSHLEKVRGCIQVDGLVHQVDFRFLNRFAGERIVAAVWDLGHLFKPLVGFASVGVDHWFPAIFLLENPGYNWRWNQLGCGT